MADRDYKNINFTEPCTCPIEPIGPDLSGTCYGNFFVFMLIMRKFIQGRCDLADPCNRFPPNRKADDEYDFVVIGGGTAGAVIAARLSANPAWKVLVLEAGGDEPAISSVPAMVTAYWWNKETDWLYYTEPQEKACLKEKDKRCFWPRAKMLGGTATFNGMMYMRGHAADYDGWAVNGAKGWSWSEVFPYFLMSENNKQVGTLVSKQYHNTGGPMPVQQFRYAPPLAHDVVAAAIELGYPPTTDLNGDNITGFTIAQTYNDEGSRYTTSRGYMRPVSYRKNLHVVFNAHVSRVVIDPILKKVTGVEYIDTKNGNEKKTVKVGKEAIISGGTMNSPHVLLLSGVGPKETLDKFNIPTIMDLPGVGQNLHTHVGVNVGFELTKAEPENELNYGTGMYYMTERAGPMSATGMSQLTGIVNSRYAPSGGRHPDIQLFFRGLFADCADGSIADREKRGADLGVSAINLQPRSRGYMTIRSVDPMDKPIFQPNYLYDDQDMKVTIEAARVAYALMNTTILQSKYGAVPKPVPECGDDSTLSDEYLRCVIQHNTAPENHQVGTCKMGPASDPMAVVDMELKVHGIDGLRVIDASIMPVVNTGNTMAPVIMIAERGAEFIITRHQRFKNQDPTSGLGNRFGDSASNSNEGDKDKWTFGDQSSGQKDDKLTDQEKNEWSNGHWPNWSQTKPLSGHHQWHNWDHKGQFQHDPEWHKKHDAYRNQ